MGYMGHPDAVMVDTKVAFASTQGGKLIIPDIEPLTVDGKTVIVVSVEAGKNRPYYLKSKGKDNGTYIRGGGHVQTGISREDKRTGNGKYELPPEAIREMIINAHCHRNLLDESCIQVAV